MTKSMSKIEFVNAQKMQSEHPDTFEAPHKEKLNNIKQGDFVKICAKRERFWCIVESVNGDTINAKVDNYLLHTDQHGYDYEDIVFLEKKHIYSILKKDEV